MGHLAGGTSQELGDRCPRDDFDRLGYGRPRARRTHEWAHPHVDQAGRQDTGMTVRKRLRLTVWIVMLCALLLGGCGEVLNEYYVSNHTETDLTIRLAPLYIETVDLASGPLIEDIRKSARSLLQQSVDYDLEGETLLFVLPIQTTIFLGFSTGGMVLFSHPEVRSDERHLIMDGDDYREYFAVQDNLVGAVVHVLDVK